MSAGTVKEGHWSMHELEFYCVGAEQFKDKEMRPLWKGFSDLGGGKVGLLLYKVKGSSTSF